jgi:hypothetical protein
MIRDIRILTGPVRQSGNYGEEEEPAQVFVDLDLSNDLHVEGFEDE